MSFRCRFWGASHSLFSLACLLLAAAPWGCGSSKSPGKKAGGKADAGPDGVGQSGEAGTPHEGRHGGAAPSAGGSQGGEAADAGGSAPTRCHISPDCALGDQCLNERCVREAACRNSRDCDTELVCSSQGRCVECVQDIECAAGLTCIGNACRPACASDRDCREQMMLCDRARGRCVECLVQEDCPTERVCNDGTCMTDVLGTGGTGDSGGAGGTGSGGRDDAAGGPGHGGEGNAANGGTAATLGGSVQSAAGTSASVGGDEPELGGTAGANTGGDAPLGGVADSSGGTPPQVGGATGAGQTSQGGAPETGGNGGAGGAIVAPGCGNGILDFEETCDDGNTLSDDCCSSGCQMEPSCACVPTALTAPSVALAATYRDFRDSAADFEPSVVGSEAATPGLLAAALGADQKPVFVGAEGDGYIASADTFDTWYRDVPDENFTLEGTLTLFRTESGAYTNRYRDTGEQWVSTDEFSAPFCGTVGYEVLDELGNPIPCTYCVLLGVDDTECTRQETDCDLDPPDRCIVNSGNYSGVYDTFYNGSPAFFPVDDVVFTLDAERQVATIPSAYGGNWDEEPSGLRHNFHFTSEIRFAFLFTGVETFELAGDDDVWMFIDGKLAIDLGGIHTPVASRLTFDASGTGSVSVWETEPDPPPTTTDEVALGLIPGHVYDVIIFQAERQTSASTFKLHLEDVAMGPTACSPM